MKHRWFAVSILVALLLVPFIVSCARDVDPGALEEILRLAERYQRESDYERAVNFFSKIIEIEPSHARAYIGRGNSYILWDEQLDLALTDFEKAIEVDALNKDGYLGCIDIYLRMGDSGKALKVAQQGYDKTEDEEIGVKLDELIEDLDDPFYPRRVRSGRRAFMSNWYSIFVLALFLFYGRQ